MRYCISSLAMGVKLFARAVRGHRAIENTCHWSLDYTYREDESRIHNEHLRENFSWLNRFTFSLLKQHPANPSLVMKCRSGGWDDNFLLQVLTGKKPLVCDGPASHSPRGREPDVFRSPE